jgi:hypothetical protein
VERGRGRLCEAERRDGFKVGKSEGEREREGGGFDFDFVVAKSDVFFLVALQIFFSTSFLFLL